MKKLIVGLVAVSVLASVCFAGSPSGPKKIRLVPLSPIEKALRSKSPAFSRRSAAKAKTETRTVYRNKYIDRPIPDPQRGIAFGFLGHYPTISTPLNETGLEFGIGYSNRMVGQSLMLKVSQDIYKQTDKYTRIKAGMIVYLGTIPNGGVFIEVERYLAPNISAIGNITPAKGGAVTIWGDAAVGGRFYLDFI